MASYLLPLHWLNLDGQVALVYNASFDHRWPSQRAVWLGSLPLKKKGREKREGRVKKRRCKCLEWRLCYRGQDPAWEGWGQWWIVIPGPPGASNASARYHLHKHCLCPAPVPLSLPSFLCLNNQSFFPTSPLRPNPGLPFFTQAKREGLASCPCSPVDSEMEVWEVDGRKQQRAKSCVFIENLEFWEDLV